MGLYMFFCLSNACLSTLLTYLAYYYFNVLYRTYPNQDSYYPVNFNLRNYNEYDRWIIYASLFVNFISLKEILKYIFGGKKVN